MIRRTIFVAAVAMIAAGCAVNDLEEAAPVCEGSSPEFYADLSSVTEETRTYVDSDLNLRWTADDRISIFTNTYNQEYRFTGKTGDNSGSFKKVPGDDFVTGNSIDRNYAVYPYGEDTGLLESGEMTVTLPAVQAYAEDTFGLGANTMVAVTSGTSDYFLPFKNLCGYLVVKLYGDATVTSVSLKGNDGEKLSGTATLTPQYGEAPAVTVSQEGTETITVDCGDGVTLGATKETATAFWFVIPPTTFSKGFTISAIDTEGWTMEKSTSSSKTIVRNVKNSMAALHAVFDTKAGFVYFEDANFKAYCVENFDTDGDGEISTAEAVVVTKIDCSDRSITSLKGVEKFTALTGLYCCSNQLTSLDVSNNTELKQLICYSNQLTSLDVSNNTKLTQLQCSSNQLTSLDVSNNTKLIELFCYSNQLTTLYVSKNTELTRLWCDSNQLTSLDVSNNTKMAELLCNSNQLTTLDVSKNTELTKLWCDSNQLTTLDVGNNTKLTELSCSSYQLTTLNVSNNTELTRLFCSSNQLTTLDVSNNTKLEDLYCSSNQLTSLDVSNNTKLGCLSCNFNQLTTLDVSKNTALTNLSCSSNQLTTLDVSNNTKLTQLKCKKNPHLTEIWLKQGQTIGDFVYDTSVATLKYKGVYESVDLGLSVKWATFNVGAEAPWEYGTYFAWGDVTGQTWNGSTWSGAGFSTNPDYELDANNNLNPEYDAAYVNWGGTWRMPTKAEQQELLNNCTSTFTFDYNGTGVAGRIFTSKKNGNSIFLPAAGDGSSSSLYNAGSYGYYWSSTFLNDNYAWFLYFHSVYVYSDYDFRYRGFSVRPVTE